MENFIIVNTENFNFIVKINGTLKHKRIVDEFSRYNGQDDTDEEMICNVFDKLGVEYEIVPALIVNV